VRESPGSNFGETSRSKSPRDTVEQDRRQSRPQRDVLSCIVLRNCGLANGNAAELPLTVPSLWSRLLQQVLENADDQHYRPNLNITASTRVTRLFALPAELRKA